MRSHVRLLAGLLALAAPRLAAADFACEKAVELQATWCTSSQITSIPQREATAVCAEYTRRLAAQCRPDWDRFKTCREFAERFTGLLVRACEDRRLAQKACHHWGDAHLLGPLGRCERGKVGY